MATYLELREQIASELARDDLTDQIRTAVLSAIRHYQRRLHLFGQSSTSLSTVAGTAEYSLPATFVAFDFVTKSINSGTLSLDPADYATLVDQGAATTQGEPTRYGYRNYKIRLDPIPDAAYSIDVYYWQALSPPSADADESAWTLDAVDLIRHRAKADLAANVLRDDAGAVAYRSSEVDTLTGIILQRDRMANLAPVVATQF